MNSPEFKKLINTIAEGWNEGNARKSADCFSEDAIYIEPPDKQVYHGRDELFEFFGGENGTDIPMHMTSHLTRRNRLVLENIHFACMGIITASSL